MMMPINTNCFHHINFTSLVFRYCLRDSGNITLVEAYS